MGVLHHRHRYHHTNHHRSLPTLTAAFTVLLFSSVSAITLARPSSAVVHNLQKSEEKRMSQSIPGIAVKKTLERGQTDQKTRFSGPGSWPPTCKSKCGWCSPCKPVHVPIQPGLSRPLEYYPEAWRCKCGDKFFMP